MANQYTADKKTLGELLSLTSPAIRVPEWQRNYSWDSSQIEIFWQDLTSFSELYPDHNISSQEYFLGSVVLVEQGDGQLLLDGQQRLGTATILLSVIRDMIHKFKADAATRIEQKYIKEIDDSTGSASYKLTLNRFDREFFKHEVQGSLLAGTRPLPHQRSHKLIADARDYFRTQFETMYSKLGGGQAAYEWSLRIRRVLTDHMSVVAILSGDEENAATVFETLNDRGIGLSTPDLLRNLLLRRAPDDESRERIIEHWQSVYDIEEADVRVDDFLRHFWLSMHGDVKTRSLYREMKRVIEDTGTLSLKFSLDMATSASLYKDMVAGNHGDRRIQRFLRDINELGAKVLYPAVLSCLSREESDDDGVALLEALIVLYTRHTVVGNRESTVLERVVYDVAQSLRSKGDTDAEIRKISAACPTDEEFRTQFAKVSIRKVAHSRYVLRELEHYKRRTKEVQVETPDLVHVEHIYPQKPSPGGGWIDHTKYVGRLGNLTLLSSKLNMSLRNAGFAVKKASYAQSDLLLTKELLTFEEWNAEAVEWRQEELSHSAIDVWRLPIPED